MDARIKSEHDGFCAPGKVKPGSSHFNVTPGLDPSMTIVLPAPQREGAGVPGMNMGALPTVLKPREPPDSALPRAPDPGAETHQEGEAP